MSSISIFCLTSGVSSSILFTILNAVIIPFPYHLFFLSHFGSFSHDTPSGVFILLFPFTESNLCSNFYNGEIILLLTAGNKSSQTNDINKARELIIKYKEA